jgi:hypothetical protein
MKPSRARAAFVSGRSFKRHEPLRGQSDSAMVLLRGAQGVPLGVSYHSLRVAPPALSGAAIAHSRVNRGRSPSAVRSSSKFLAFHRSEPGPIAQSCGPFFTLLRTQQHSV